MMALTPLLEILRLFFGAVTGLFFSGYLLARWLRSSSPALLAFPLSLLVLFHCVFLIGLIGLPITFENVLIPILVLTLIFWLLASRWENVICSVEIKWFYAICAAVLCLFMLQQTLLTPLSGYDTFFRWDYLAQRILELREFNFYPPRHAADFKDYYFVDGFPPIVSFAYWWVYAAFGEYIPKLSALIVVPQYLVVLGLVWKIARRISPADFANRAGWLAVTFLALSSAYFRDQAIGQESGLMAVSLLGLIWVLLSDEGKTIGADAIPPSPGTPGEGRGEGSTKNEISSNSRKALTLTLSRGTGRGDKKSLFWFQGKSGQMLLAAACAAIGAMCREYGWAYALFGLAMILWRYRSIRLAGIFLLASLIFAGPWYLRNFILTGNPFYSLKFLGLPVNSVFAGMMESYRPHFGVTAWNATRWRNIIIFLFVGSPIQLTLGMIGAIVLLRKYPSLAVAVIMSFALWLYSAGYTNGGEEYSSRTLAPAWAILSVTAAIWAASIRSMRWLLDSTIAVCFLAAITSAWIFPFSFYNPPEGSWLTAGLHKHPRQDPVEAMVPQIQAALPPHSRILGDGLVMHALLRQVGYELVPPWSPEVAFLFDANVSADQAIARLRAMHIDTVLAVPGGTNTFYFVEHSRFYQDASRWKRIGAAPGVALFRLPG